MTMYLTDQLIHNANNKLKKLYEGCLSNRLTINATKTHFMLFTISKKLNFPLPHLLINDKIIYRIDKIQFLGVTYDYLLPLKHHVNKLT